MRIATRALAIVLAATALVLPLAANAATISLTGEVSYNERVDLPPGATLRLQLIDLSAADMPTRVDVRAPIGSPGQVPLSFGLNFDDRLLVPANRHGLIAEILSGDQVWFRNERPLELDPLAPPAGLAVLVSLAGRLMPAGGQPSDNANVSAADAAIVGKTWRAAEIGSQPALGDIDSTLLIESDRRAGGRGGCNSYFAHARITGSAIQFSAPAATRMACRSDVASAQETAYFEALEKTRYWRLEGDFLILLDASQTQVLRFTAMTR